MAVAPASAAVSVAVGRLVVVGLEVLRELVHRRRQRRWHRQGDALGDEDPLTLNGKPLTNAAAGTYKLVVVDSSKTLNLSLLQIRGVEQPLTTTAFTGTKTVTVDLLAGQWKVYSTVGKGVSSSFTVSKVGRAGLPPGAAAAAAGGAREERDQPDERQDDGDDEEPVNGEADSERDNREQREQHEQKHPVTFLSGSFAAVQRR